MENVVLTVHLILALLLIVVVLLQRSEGGGLGMGGSGGGVMTGRQAANALSKATWLLATGFLITSMALTVLAARKAGSGSVVDDFYPTSEQPAKPAEGVPGSTLPAYTPPPPAASGQPVLPPTPAAPAAPAPAAPAPAANVPATPPASAPAPASN